MLVYSPVEEHLDCFPRVLLILSFVGRFIGGIIFKSRSSDFGHSSPSQAIEVSFVGLFLHLIADSQAFDVNISNCDN